jgi:hypothetical protein
MPQFPFSIAAFGAAPMVKTQAPAYYRMMPRDFERQKDA